MSPQRISKSITRLETNFVTSCGGTRSTCWTLKQTFSALQRFKPKSSLRYSTLDSNWSAATLPKASCINWVGCPFLLLFLFERKKKNCSTFLLLATFFFSTWTWEEVEKVMKRLMPCGRLTLTSRLWLDLCCSFFFIAFLQIFQSACVRTLWRWHWNGVPACRNVKSLSNLILNLVFFFLSFFFACRFFFEAVLELCLSHWRWRGPTKGKKRLLGVRQELSSHLEKLRPRLFISSPLCCVSRLLAVSLLPEMRYLWKTVNISIHSMLAEYALAHVSVVSAFFMAACKDSSSSLWMLASVNLWGSISK